METLICATHPARRASLTCERCGNYACCECAFDAPWGVSVCAPCKSRGALVYPLDWERGSMWNPLRFARSARDVLLDAPTLFANLPSGGFGRAFGFCAWVAVCLAACALWTEAQSLRVDWRDIPTLRALSLYGASRFVEHVARTYVIVLVSGLSFHLIARAFGGAASPEVAARTAGYGSAFLLYNLAAALAASLTPWLELAALVIATMIQSYFYFTCLGIAAVEHYGISRSRSAAVAGVTVALLVPSMFVAMTLITAVGMYATRFAVFFPRGLAG
jgi:hypothetical protein